MKQPQQWDEREVALELMQSAQPACGMPLSRVAWLRRWRNIYTGEISEQTTAEFSQSKAISLERAYHLVKSGDEQGWKHEAKLHKTIQGDAIAWLTQGPVRNGSKTAQAKETIGTAWNHSALILALYAKGNGIKAIARRFNLSPRAVMILLIQTGINTSARRNYQKHKKPLRTINGPKSSYDRIKVDPVRRLKKQVMGRIWSAMKRQHVNGSGSFALVGCTPEELRDHIAKHFAAGMSFENYGEWHVDHVRPCASFDLSDLEQVKACFNWRNLRPLWAADNIRKGASYAEG